MEEKQKTRLYKLKKILRISRKKSQKKETPEPSIRIDEPNLHEKRREEALKYVLKKHFESKKREEELRKKLESYGRVRRWLYERWLKLKNIGFIFKQIVVKPLAMLLAIGSGGPSMVLAIIVRPHIVRFLSLFFPSLFSDLLGGITTFFIGFSPIFISLTSYTYYLDRQMEKRLREEHGM